MRFDGPNKRSHGHVLEHPKAQERRFEMQRGTNRYKGEVSRLYEPNHYSALQLRLSLSSARWSGRIVGEDTANIVGIWRRENSEALKTFA